MASCDVCGQTAVTMALIEGAKMNVCNRCRAYGREIRPTFNKGAAKPAHLVKKMEEVSLVEDFGKILTNAREDFGLTREELAKKLAMREQDLKNFETGKVKPTQKEAQKLEEILGTVIIKTSKDEQEQEEKEDKNKASEKYAPTLGELVTIKTKKN